jgi:4-amino-4-deoxy-L-arabinose transferase-like glycosyltransferase
VTRSAGLALAACVLLALCLRAPWLDSVPGPLHPDEAQDAVHARELFDRPALTFPHEGGGWDEGVYVWLAAPCVRLADALGWPTVEAAVRLPALAAGLALVVALFLSGRDAGSLRLGLLAALLVALTPWAVHLSRLALRASLVPPLVVLGLGLLDPTRARRALAGLCLALACLTYPPARLVVPLLALVHVATLRPRPTARQAALLLAPPWVVLLALLPWTLGPEGGARVEQVLALDPDAPLLDNAWRALRGWAVHLSPRFLFSGATSRGFAPEGVGLVPLAWAPLLVLGLCALALRARGRDPGAARLLAWLALAPLAAALTTDVPNALRDVVALPALVLVMAHGGDVLLARVPARGRAAAAAALAAVLALGAALPLRDYALVHPAREAAFYRAGRRELAREVAARAAAGEAVLVRGEFVRAYLRLYAPDLPLRHAPGGLVAGAGPPRWELTLEGGGPARWRRLS